MSGEVASMINVKNILTKIIISPKVKVIFFFQFFSIYFVTTQPTIKLVAENNIQNNKSTNKMQTLLLNR